MDQCVQHVSVVMLPRRVRKCVLVSMERMITRCALAMVFVILVKKEQAGVCAVVTGEWLAQAGLCHCSRTKTCVQSLLSKIGASCGTMIRVVKHSLTAGWIKKAVILFKIVTLVTMLETRNQLLNHHGLSLMNRLTS